MAQKRIPDNVHLLKGTYQKIRHGDKDSKVSVDVPISTTPPRSLSKEAKTEWKRIIKLVERTGILTGWDQTVLAQYCELTAEFYDTGREFNAAKHTQLRLCAVELGLTPSSRSKVTVTTKKDDDEF